jgi:hypothetical protein
MLTEYENSLFQLLYLLWYITSLCELAQQMHIKRTTVLHHGAMRDTYGTLSTSKFLVLQKLMAAHKLPNVLSCLRNK